MHVVMYMCRMSEDSDACHGFVRDFWCERENREHLASRTVGGLQYGEGLMIICRMYYLGSIMMSYAVHLVCSAINLGSVLCHNGFTNVF